jgi:hypothetical protein
VSVPRDPELVALEGQFRQAIRDAVNRRSRKPFYWGGLVGYRQLEAIAQAMEDLCDPEEQTAYLSRIARQVRRVLEKNRASVADLQTAHTWLRRIAACLRYPPSQHDSVGLSSGQVADEMNALREQFQPDLKRQSAQAALYRAWRRHWKAYGDHLMHCYDIPGLPPDNLEVEALFGRLRSHQRRVSGRSSTKELRDSGHYQVFAFAENEADLLRSMRAVPLAEYQAQRHRMQATETPGQFLRRLHHDPAASIQQLSQRYAARRAQLRFAVGDEAASSCVHTD